MIYMIYNIYQLLSGPSEEEEEEHSARVILVRADQPRQMLQVWRDLLEVWRDERSLIGFVGDISFLFQYFPQK